METADIAAWVESEGRPDLLSEAMLHASRGPVALPAEGVVSFWC